MADVNEPEIRSYNMSQIKCKDTKLEMLVRKFLHAHFFRYCLHDKKLLGKLDIVLPEYNIIVMVHESFWCVHEEYKYYAVSKARTRWWLDKIDTNKCKNKENESKLEKLRWDVITIFECGLKLEKRNETLTNLTKKIHDDYTRN